MKILVIGLDGAVPELLFGEGRLTNFRRLMEFGCYGRLQSVITPTAVPAWACMATSQDPGSIGLYGFRNRVDYSYSSQSYSDMKLAMETALWAHLGEKGKRSVLIGVPIPPDVNDETVKTIGEYPAEAKVYSASEKNRLEDEIYARSRKHFEVVRHHLGNSEWDYFQFVESGLDCLQHKFWQFHDPQHVLHQPGNPYEHVIRDYYFHLDNELEKILELLTDDTIVLVASDYGAQRLDGIFCVNEWLMEEGLLVLNDNPKGITPFYKLNVNWEKTKVWSEGAQVFFNVKGREPKGTIAKTEYEIFRDEIKTRIEGTVDDKGEPMGTLVFKPEEIYKSVRNFPPDLIVQCGGHWHSDDNIGYRAIRLQPERGWQNSCNHTLSGCFILAAPNNPLRAEVEGAHLLDIAPTLLELGGHEVPTSMQGKSLMAGKTLDTPTDTVYSVDEEEAIRKRLSGLGYI